MPSLTPKGKETRPAPAVPAKGRASVPAPQAAKAGGKPARQQITPGASAHQDEAVATELARNAYSRERYEFLLKTLFGLIMALVLSIGANIYFGTREPQFRYFATDPDGNIRQLDPQQQPIQSSHEVLNWASTAITRAFTMSFANYRQELDGAKFDFTEPGWRGFEQALSARGVMDSIINNKYVTSVTPTAAPVIVAQGFVNNSYAWKIELPILVTYESASTRTSQSMLVEATVVRRPPQEHPRGLGIAQIIAK